MIILALDTSLGACSAAVMVDGELAAQAFELRARGHAERLATMISDVLDAAGLAPQNITRLGVTTGPGTFTGQRVGLAFARAFALAITAPVIGITTLEALAATARAWLPGRQAPAGCAILAAIDARRDEIYLQSFSPDLTALTPPQLVALQQAHDMLGEGDYVLAGSGAPLLAPLLPQMPRACFEGLEPDARFVAERVALLPAPAAPPSAFYLRPPDVRLPKDRQHFSGAV
jgi:tRNA threonylcarbamoyl adenosine modification protein YeaZ